MSELRVLTGITTSGTPHLGNYVGAVRPAVRASLAPGVQSFYFLADYHALIKIDEPARIQRSTLEIAASWLATGLDPARVVDLSGAGDAAVATLAAGMAAGLSVRVSAMLANAAAGVVGAKPGTCVVRGDDLRAWTAG